MGIPIGAVRQALQKEGKDPNIVDMDSEKSYASQVKKEEKVEEDTGPALKDDPEYAKFFKVSKYIARFRAMQYLVLYLMLIFYTWHVIDAKNGNPLGCRSERSEEGRKRY